MYPYDQSEKSRFKPAAICRRGHTITQDLTARADLAERCPDCGAPVLTECPSCGHRIRGYHHVPGVISIGGTYPAEVLRQVRRPVSLGRTTGADL